MVTNKKKGSRSPFFFYNQINFFSELIITDYVSDRRGVVVSGYSINSTIILSDTNIPFGVSEKRLPSNI